MNTRNVVPRILYRSGTLQHLNIEQRISVNNTRVRVPIIKGWGLGNLGLSEPWMLVVLKALQTIRTGLFVDVGVNLGQTLIKVKAVDPHQAYLGFEPDAHCVFYVQELIRANNYDQCTIVPIGLSDTMGLSALYSASEGDSAATIVSDFRELSPDVNRQFVPVFRLDEVVDTLSIGDIAVLKIDVEGAEIEVLDGAQEVIAKYRPFIFCEVLPIYDDATANGQFRKARQVRLLALLENLDYRLGRIDPATGKIQLLESIETHGDMTRCDYLFVPGETSGIAVSRLC